MKVFSSGSGKQSHGLAQKHRPMSRAVLQHKKAAALRAASGACDVAGCLDTQWPDSFLNGDLAQPKMANARVRALVVRRAA